MINLTISRKVQAVKHLECICASAKKTLTSFSLIYYLPKKKNTIMMVMNTSRECCGFSSLASPCTFSCSLWQLLIFSHITENGTIHPFVANPEQLLSSFTITASSWYLITLELSRHILPHVLSQHTGCTKVDLFSLLMVTLCSTSSLI